MTKQPLRRCKWLGVGEGERLSRNTLYRCLVPLPALPDLPTSVTRGSRFDWPPRRLRVIVDDHCTTCPLYEGAKKGGAQ